MPAATARGPRRTTLAKKSAMPSNGASRYGSPAARQMASASR
jgi:hypothetical protein